MPLPKRNRFVDDEADDAVPSPPKKKAQRRASFYGIDEEGDDEFVGDQTDSESTESSKQPPIAQSICGDYTTYGLSDRMSMRLKNK